LHHAYGGQCPDLTRALEFYDRWLPGTMRHIALITRPWRGLLGPERGRL